MLGCPSGGGDDLDGHLWVPTLYVRRGRSGDVGAEAVRCRHPHDANTRAPRESTVSERMADSTASAERASRPRSVSSQPPATRASTRPPIDCSSEAMRREIVVWLRPSSSAAVV